jgi:hypothetical protein
MIYISKRFLHSMSIICNYRIPQDTEHKMDDIKVILQQQKKTWYSCLLLQIKSFRSKTFKPKYDPQTQLRCKICCNKAASLLMGCSWWLFTNIVQKPILGRQHLRTKTANEKGLESIGNYNFICIVPQKALRKDPHFLLWSIWNFQEDTISGYSKSIHLQSMILQMKMLEKWYI